MATKEQFARAMAIAEAAVQDMAAEGLDAQARAIGLAYHMQRQAELAMPTKETAAAFKASLALSGSTAKNGM